jgi:hypothetical protein
MAGQNIDRDKLRAAIRKMSTEYVFLMLNDAITLLPERKLRKLIAQYLNPPLAIRLHQPASSDVSITPKCSSPKITDTKQLRWALSSAGQFSPNYFGG